MVDKNFFKIIKNNQQGQALFELIIFIPFLIFLYTIYSTTGNSINASINQQKAVRGYFYSLLKGNSYLNTFEDLEKFKSNGIRMVGFSSLGWRDHSSNAGQKSYAPCFEFSSLLKSTVKEDCDQRERETDKDGRAQSSIVRVFTAYGVCGPVYSEVSDPTVGSFFFIHPSTQSDPSNCSLGSSNGI